MKKNKKPTGYWDNYDICKKEAEKCASKTEFFKRNISAYNAAKRNKWLDEWFTNMVKPNGYWDNYDNCKEEALKYKTRSEFSKNNRPAYAKARQYGWLVDFFGENTTKKPKGYWNIKENCDREAKKYRTKNEFREKAMGAYQSAKKHKWLGEYNWFITKSEAISIGNTQWTKEKCEEAAKKCKTRGEFSKYNTTAYLKSLNNGWLDEWFGKETAQRHNKYWTYETCYEEAKKYKYLSDFVKNSNGAYCAARKNGWIKDYHWLKKNKTNEGPFCVYAYEDVDNKTSYVGLTNNIKRRHYHHKHGIKNNGQTKYDVVAIYFMSVKKEMPLPKIKMDELEAEDAQYYEDWYRNKYAELGWRVLNIGKTGIGSSSIGGKRKWTEETIKEEIKRLGCTSRWDLGKKNGGAYAAALKLKIMDNLFPIKKVG